MNIRLLSRMGFALIRLGFRLPFASKIIQFEEYRRVRDLIVSERVNLVIDVGAYHGWFAEHLRWAGYKGKIISYEPEGGAFRVLEKAASRDHDWHVRRCALGAEIGEMHLNIVHSMGVLNSLRNPIHTGAANSTELIKVAILDSHLEMNVEGIAEPRIFLKLDTQGFDLEVLRGGGRTLENVVLLQSEVSVIPLYHEMPHYTDALAHYEELGFVLQDLFVVTRSGSRPVEYDAIMTRSINPD